MDFFELAKNRYSCRKFSDKKVENDKIKKIIEVALLAPTAVNFQPFKVWVIESPECIEKLKIVTPYTFGVKTVIAVGANPDDAYVRKFDNKNFAPIDGTIASTFIMLGIHDLGLGTTWVGHFDDEKLKTLFPEMKGYVITALFPIGYPADDAGASDMHYKSKSEKDVVSHTYSA